MDAKKDIMWRVYVIYVFMVIFGLSVVYKMFQIQVAEGEHWRSRAVTLTTTYNNIEAIRGNIYASDGSLLATSIPTYEVRFDSKVESLTDELFNSNVDSLAFCLSQLFKDKTQKQFRRRLIAARKEGSRYALIQRNVDYNEMTEMRTFPLCRLGRYKSGFIYIQQNDRKHPFMELAYRTIGKESKNGRRPVGLEGAYDKYLRGEGGKRLMQKISGGVWKPINDENEIEPKDGSDIITTIDVTIQDVAEKELERQLIANDSDHGCVVLMEVETGQIKAIANLKKAQTGGYYESYNYAVGESTEPGSTFKLPALMVALEDAYIDLDDSVFTENGKTKFYDQEMKDSHVGGYGWVTVKEALEKSSNVAVSKIISKYYKDNPQKFVDRLYKMNLNDKLGLEIAGEGAPRIKTPADKDWSGITLPWMSIGYEVRQTPIQILTFYNAVANGGKMVKPYFINEVTKRGRAVKSFKPIVLNESICSKETIEKAQQMLEGVIENGTARNLNKCPFKIAGKTGTVQIANTKYGYKYQGRYSYQASFVGYFPADKPKYSCIVVVNAPGKNVYYGNLVAGPIFKEIAEKVYAGSIDIHEDLRARKQLSWKKREDGTLTVPYAKYGSQQDLKYVCEDLNLPAVYENPESMWAVALPGENTLEILVRKIENELSAGIVPNVVGMNAQDAIYLLENAGMTVRILGSGLIVKQSLKPGEKLYSGSEILLQLS